MQYPKRATPSNRPIRPETSTAQNASHVENNTLEGHSSTLQKHSREAKRTFFAPRIAANLKANRSPWRIAHKIACKVSEMSSERAKQSEEQREEEAVEYP